MTGNVQLYLAEAGRALTRMAARLVGFVGRVKVVGPHREIRYCRETNFTTAGALCSTGTGRVQLGRSLSRHSYW